MCANGGKIFLCIHVVPILGPPSTLQIMQVRLGSSRWQLRSSHQMHELNSMSLLTSQSHLIAYSLLTREIWSQSSGFAHNLLVALFHKTHSGKKEFVRIWQWSRINCNGS